MRMSVTDEALALAAAAGDREAFAALLERRYDGLFRLCFRLCGSRTEAEDLTQDICAALPAKLAGFRADAKVSTWLYRVVVNLSTDRLRRRRSVPLDAAPEPEDGRPGADEGLIEADRAAALEAALQTLPERQREAVVLRHLEGLANPEIAEIMGVGVEAVESLTARGKRGLMRALAGRREELGYGDG